MKILYAIQGTGNGHISRALDVVPALQRHGDVDILLSGTEADLELPFPVKYRLHGLCFVFGKKGGIDYVETYRRANIKRLFAEIKALPVTDYDVVISDFEPVSAWACKLQRKLCAGLSHQAAVVHRKAPRPSKPDAIGQAVLQHYAPADIPFGFHFLPYAKNIFTPIIRAQVRALQPTIKGHYTVYLPAYSNKRLLRFLSMFPDIRWEVFSKHCTAPHVQGNISILPVNNEAFVQSMSGATGVLCGAGFETPAEVIYLQKKLLVVPMKGQYEQQCNAAALKMMGVPVLKNLKKGQAAKVQDWLLSDTSIALDYPDETDDIVTLLLRRYLRAAAQQKPVRPLREKSSGFRALVLNKIFYRTPSAKA